MRVPDSPDDRRARNEILTRVGKRIAIAVVAIALVGLLANALGVPWWLVLVVCVFALLIVVFEA
jgi:fatty acid desaturase